MKECLKFVRQEEIVLRPGGTPGAVLVEDLLGRREQPAL